LLKRRRLPTIDYVLNIILDKRLGNDPELIYQVFNTLLIEKKCREDYFKLLAQYNSDESIELQMINLFIATLQAEHKKSSEYSEDVCSQEESSLSKNCP